MIVIDSSVLVSAVLDDGQEGQWALTLTTQEELLAPDHLLVEVHNVLRRLELRGLNPAAVAMARAQVVRLPVELVPFAVLADRTWDLRGAVSAYDAAYVALAEHADAPLATLDRRLARAPGPRCTFLLPERPPGR